MAVTTFSLYAVGGSSAYATIDDDGNINATGELRVDGVAVSSIDTTGNLSLADSIALRLGTGLDDNIAHNGTLTTWTHTTGNLLVDNTAATGATIFRLGTDTTATGFSVKTDSDNVVFSIVPASATAATVLAAGVLDLNGTLDQDFVLTGTGDGANITGTISHATQVAEGLDVQISQLTNVRTGGTVTGVQSTVVSLTGDTAGIDYYSFWAKCTAGEAAADHIAFKVGAGFDTIFDLTSCATSEGALRMADNLAVGFAIYEASTAYLTFKTTNDTERITFGKVRADTITTVDMANAAHALVYATAGAAETKLLGNVVWVDANGGSNILTLPAVATSTGVTIYFVNTGGEDVVAKDVAAATIFTMATTECAFATCNGTIWLGGVVTLT